MVGGMGRAVVDHQRAERIAEAARGGFPEAMLAPQLLAIGPGAFGIAHHYDRDAGRPSAAFDLRQTPADIAAVQAQAGTGLRPQKAYDLDCLTQAVYFEARGETPRGQAAVAQVVLNRVKHPAFPKTVCAVVYQGAAAHGCQFSFACDGSMRREREPGAWERARQIAARALAGAVLTDVGSATHFHTTGVDPAWGPRMLRVAQVGLHVFYRFNPHAPTLRPEEAEEPEFVSLPAASAGPIRLAVALTGKAADATAQAVNASLQAPTPAPTPVAAPAPPTDPKPVAVTKTSDSKAPEAVSAPRSGEATSS